MNEKIKTKNKSAIFNKKNTSENILTSKIALESLNSDMTEGGISLLVAAIFNNRSDVVNTLLSHNETNINQPTMDGKTPVYHAAVRGVNEILRMLLENQADLHLQDENGLTPLHGAAGYNDIETVDIILNTTAGRKLLNTTTKDGLTPLHIAVATNQSNIVETLLDYKELDINKQDKEGWTAVYFASSLGLDKILNKLIEKRAKVDIPANNGLLPLTKAVLKDHIEVIKILLTTKEGKLSLNSTSPEIPSTILQIAVFQNKTNIVKLLVAHDETDVNQPNEFGHTPLYFAALNGNTEILKILIQSGAFIHAESIDGTTALHTTCFHGHMETAKILLANNAIIDKQDKYLRTPLFFAVGMGHEDLVWFLLEKGAKLSNIRLNPLVKPRSKGLDTFVNSLLGT